ncbi:MAG: CDP-alcohol phosphatidyltransferase family protein [Acidimicrobiales bacterium]
MTAVPGLSVLGPSRWAAAANSLTVSRLLVAPVLAALVLYRNPWWVTFVLGVVLGFTDAIDGSLARRATPTRLGAFLDPLADKLVVLLVAYALVVVGRFSWIPVTLIAVREIGLVGYRSYWARHGLAVPARRSGKYKTLVQGIALAAALLPPLEPYPWVADVLLWLAVGFTLVSGAQYLIDGRDALRSTGQR